MAKGKTLWEMLVEKFQGPVELQYYNPLKAKIGSAVTIDDVEHRDLNFFVREIREYKRTLSGKQFFFVDYVLLARPLNEADVLLRLRLNPVDDPDREGGLTHHALLLHLFEDMAYNEGLHQVVQDSTGKFEVLENEQVQEEYWRINDVLDSYKARVNVIRDVNEDRKVSKDEVEGIKLEYWDYWRETPDEALQPVKEYLFVEMDGDSGWFQIWKGREIDPQKVLIM